MKKHLYILFNILTFIFIASCSKQEYQENLSKKTEKIPYSIENLSSKKFKKQHLNFLKKSLKEDSYNTMNVLPPKKYHGKIPSFFSKKNIKDKSYIESKNSVREFLSCQSESGCLSMPTLQAVIKGDDLAEDLLDIGKNHIKNLNEMEAYLSGELERQPWSGDYWALALGSLGFRYMEYENQALSYNWEKIRKEHKRKSVLDYIDKEEIYNLSPSEKFDLAIGDESFYLTKNMWEKGAYFHNAHGRVERWMGICHGWAAAAFMLPRPRCSVTVKNKKGYKIKFLPSDIKALGSLLWANSDPDIRFIGGRCDKKKPNKDKETGRIIDFACFDTNPGTWHKVVVNQIGVSRRSFIIDTTFDYEVWNYPVYSYSYSYFRVKEEGEVEVFDDWKKARVLYSEYKDIDLFKKYRKPKSKTKYIVGVIMNVKLSMEIEANRNPINTPEHDASQEIIYTYDLEVSKDGTILGGEWYSNIHPDFMWTPVPNSQADHMNSEYFYSDQSSWWRKGNEIIFSENELSFIQSLSQEGIPLASFVKKLFKESSEGKCKIE